MLPRLLTEALARDYLGGIDPRKVTPPLRLGRSIRWDRRALDQALDRQSGLSLDQPPTEEDAYAQRQARKRRER